MRIPAVALGAALALSSLFAVTAPSAHADSGSPTVAAEATAPVTAAVAQPGTHEEEDAYARREAASPKVQEFAGGFIIGVLVVVVLVIVIIILARAI